ncbi:hypothetical protein QR680_003091 [Steinernema hermaphroditum]|uniref:G-protein coupled receptors family 1 profile domain-containing protein n=1 Tax=Steinernema hermaphroditum TaxID=289476 RepID=A0AA39LJM1_9BILA|nr:hypothetical protein QR680_003091 [Steinernema hermaphroditum]
MMFGSYTIVPQRNLCLTDIALQFTRGIDDIIQRYIFPVEFPIGVIGNCIILLVLLSKENRTTPCLLLSAMAFSDIAYLFTLLPWWLASYGIFYRNRTFRLYFYIARMNVTAIANLFSAAANWLIMAVSLHRYTRTREPSRTRVRWPSWKSCCLIFAVFTLAAVVTSHNHIAYHVKIIPLCNRTQYAAVAHPVGPDRPMLAKWGSFMEFIVLLVMPIIVVSILCYLLYTGRRNRDISMTSANKLRTLDGETTPMIGEYGKERRESNKTRNSEQESIARQECLSEITVVAIGTCFVITHVLQ